MLTEQRIGPQRYCWENYVDREDYNTRAILAGEWREEVRSVKTALKPAANIRRLSTRNANRDVLYNRDIMKNYLNSEVGSVP